MATTTEARILLRPTHGVVSPPDRIGGPDAGAGAADGQEQQRSGQRAGRAREPLLQRRGPLVSTWGRGARHEVARPRPGATRGPAGSMVVRPNQGDLFACPTANPSSASWVLAAAPPRKRFAS